MQADNDRASVAAASVMRIIGGVPLGLVPASRMQHVRSVNTERLPNDGVLLGQS